MDATFQGRRPWHPRRFEDVRAALDSLDGRSRLEDAADASPPAIAQRMPVSHPMVTCMGGPGLTVTGVEGQRGNTLPVIRTAKV
jgi:hypothetical protein